MFIRNCRRMMLVGDIVYVTRVDQSCREQVDGDKDHERLKQADSNKAPFGKSYRNSKLTVDLI